MTFAEKLKQLRKAKGKTQGQVAIALRVSVKAIGAYEESRCEPSIELLKSIAIYYNVTTDYLLGAMDTNDAKAPITYLFDRAPKGIKDSVIKLLS